MADPHGLRADDVDYLAGLVRGVDRPRYYATLFAPEELRADLFALYGFAAEIGRIPDLVKDSTLGRIRLQWWRDALDGAAGSGAGGDTPALRAVLYVARRYALPIDPLKALVDARSADLFSDPPPTLAELEEFLGKTESLLFTMGAVIAGAPSPVVAQSARHAGLAYGLARRLAGFAGDTARGRTILPHNLLATERLQGADIFAAQPNERVRHVITALADLSRRHLRAARERTLPRQASAVFLPLAVVEPLLARITRLDAEMLNRNVVLPDLEVLARLTWARLRGT